MTGQHLARVLRPDGRLSATCGYKEFKIWQVQTGRLIHDLGSDSEGGCSLSFSPDGRLLASTGGYDSYSPIKIWDVHGDFVFFKRRVQRRVPEFC